MLKAAIACKAARERELARRGSLGVGGPVPHPGDVVIDPSKGEVRISGPTAEGA